MSDQLPIPHYDQLPLAGLTHRIRTLDADGVEALLRHERAHGDRTPVVEMLSHRLEALHAGAEPSGGDPAGLQPERAPAPEGGSTVPTESETDNNQPLRYGVAGQTPNRDIRAR